MTTNGRKRILIVEDQQLIAADLENTLTNLGYEIVGNVPSGEEAIQTAFSMKPDLVLMDIQLQGEMDGIQAARVISGRLDVPIAYLTAYADDETLTRAKITTPFGYVLKPYDERELRAAVEIALYKHENDRRLAEERAARKAAEEFRALVEGVQDHAIYRMDTEGRVMTWNTGAERITGYSADEIIGKPSSIFYRAEDRNAKEPEAELQTAATQGRVVSEGWRVKKDGTVYWVSATTTALFDDSRHLRGFATVSRDLTERKRREDRQAFLDEATAALASSLDISTTMQRAAQLAVPVLSDYCVIQLVDGHGRLTETAVAHADAKKEALARKLVPDALASSALHGPGQALRSQRSEIYPDPRVPGLAREPLDTEHPEALRELVVVSYICVPIRYAGDKHGVLSLLRAAPARIYTEPDLAVAEEFARRAGLAIENARLYREAHEAIRARDEFLQIASHELKTPLTPLQMQLDTLGRALGKAGVQNERLVSKLEMASRQTARLNRLVESLLDVARITSGRFVLEIEEFDFAEMIRDVAERFRSEAKKAQCEIILQVEGEIVGRWDRLRIEQILSNLLSNAFKYGEGKPVEISARAADDMVRLVVTDHGIGIEKDALERIFDRFERAVSMRHYGGLGLGLFIARQIAEAHGGSIVAQSQPGFGSVFTVLLPQQSGEWAPSEVRGEKRH